MVQVAAAKGRWIARADLKKRTPAGLIVCFDWDKSADPLATDHCGIVINANSHELYTIEFNTSATVDGNQRDGGVVQRRVRMLNDFVKGFVETSSRS
jgi:hypothetical protein